MFKALYFVYILQTIVLCLNENCPLGSGLMLGTCSTEAIGQNWNPDVFLGIENGRWLEPPQSSITFDCYAPGQRELNGSSVLRRTETDSGTFYWYKNISIASIVCIWKQSSHCISDFSYISQFNICVKVVSKTYAAFMAYNFCNQNNKGSPPITSSAERNEFFYSLVKSSFFNPFGNFTWLGKSLTQNNWYDHTPMNYTNFIEPPTNDTINDPTLCLAKGTASKWLYLPCENYSTAYFICQYTP